MSNWEDQAHQPMPRRDGETMSVLPSDSLARERYRKVFKIAKRAGAQAELMRGVGNHRYVLLAVGDNAWAATIAEGPYGPPEAGLRVWQVTDRTRGARGPKGYTLETWAEAKVIIKAIAEGNCAECAILQSESPSDPYVICDYCSYIEDEINDMTWD